VLATADAADPDVDVDGPRLLNHGVSLRNRGYKVKCS
jgi:hypothetical protein